MTDHIFSTVHRSVSLDNLEDTIREPVRANEDEPRYVQFDLVGYQLVPSSGKKPSVLTIPKQVYDSLAARVAGMTKPISIGIMARTHSADYTGHVLKNIPPGHLMSQSIRGLRADRMIIDDPLVKDILQWHAPTKTHLSKNGLGSMSGSTDSTDLASLLKRSQSFGLVPIRHSSS